MRKYRIERKLRVVNLNGGRYKEYTVGLPRQWVEAILRERHIEANDLRLTLQYNGEILITPKEV
ncbi:hypothetical protein ES703_84580 [subsurface metagenome]